MPPGTRPSRRRLPLISIVIVNYNGARHLEPCLRSLKALAYPRRRYETLVVDNGSTDHSAELVHRQFPKVRWIAHTVNHYTRALNVGIKLANGALVACLNNDTVVDSRWLIELVQVMQRNPTVGACGSKVVLMDGRLNSTGHRPYPSFYWVDRGSEEPDRGQYDQLEQVESLTGCAVLLRRSALEQVGFFDEDFVMYMEDVDLALRLQQRGWTLCYVPTSVVHHVLHGTPSERSAEEHTERNRLLLIAKHYPNKLVDALYGRGYWAYPKQPQPGSLLRLMPVLLDKLVKHHGPKRAAEVIRSLFDELHRVQQYELDMLLRSDAAQRAQLRQQLDELTRTSQAKQVSDQQQLATQEAELTAHRQQLEVQTEALRTLEAELSSQRQTLAERTATLTTAQADRQVLAETVRAREAELVARQDERQQLIQDLTTSQQQLKTAQAEQQTLAEVVNRIYRSQTYRYLAKPIWTCLDFLKRLGSRLTRQQGIRRTLPGGLAHGLPTDGKPEMLQSEPSSSRSSEALVTNARESPHARFVSIIIVNYNGAHLLEPCLESVTALDYPPAQYEVLVVDNGSMDGSAELVQRRFPRVRWIAHMVNDYCRALNVGISLSHGDFIAFLNNDTRVDPQWLSELVKRIEQHPQIGACGSKVLLMNGLINSTGHRALPNFYWIDRGFKEPDTGQYDRLEEVESLSGCAVLIRRRALDDVGGLDEDFGMYVEDIDLSRCLRQRGWKLYYVPTSIVHHVFHGSAKEEDVEYWVERNRLLFLAKHDPEQLGEALVGRGYWSRQRQPQPGGLLGVMPVVVNKLLKHHGLRRTNRVLQELCEQRHHIQKEELTVELNRIDQSRTSRYLARPMWRCLDVLKSSKGRLANGSRPQTRRRPSALARAALTLEPTLKPMIRRLIPQDSRLWSRLRALGYHVRENGVHVGGVRVDQTPPSGSFGVNVLGHLYSEKGVGESMRSAVRALQAAHVPYGCNNFNDPGSLNLDAKPCPVENPYPVNLIHVHADGLPSVIHALGEQYFKGRYNIGQWVWELPDFPPEWCPSFKYFDEIWVPSRFVQEAIARVAPVPVMKIPYTIALEREVDGVAERKTLEPRERRFVFLFMFDFMSYWQRKNPFGVIETFQRAFPKIDGAELIVKTTHASFSPKVFQQLQDVSRGLPIKVVDGVWSRQAISELLSACDCVVSLHRSEGFGLSLAEAMALGKPVIATGYSGNMDFMTPENSLPVDYRLVQLKEDVGPYMRGSHWAEPDLDHAAAHMRWVASHREQARTLGERAGQTIHDGFSPAVVGKMITERLQPVFNAEVLSEA